MDNIIFGMVRTRKEGKDLIAVFDGAGSGIGPNEFAPKLLGRGKKGDTSFDMVDGFLPIIRPISAKLLFSVRPFSISTRCSNVKCF